MKAYFINPPRINPNVSSYEMPLGILTLVAAIEHFSPEVPVEIVDLQLNPNLGLSHVIVDERAVICMSILSYNAQIVYKLCQTVKKINPNCIVILGGPHVTLQKEKIFEESCNVDYISIGEGDISLPKLLRNLYSGNAACEGIAGIRRKDGMSGGENSRITDLSQLPSIIEGMKHYDMSQVIQRNGYVSYIASRGCPFDCIYCASSSIWGHRISFFDSNRVCDDLDWLAAQGVKYINFRDDIFTVNKTWLKPVLAKLKELNIIWGCETRADCIDRATLEEMKASGCELIRFGVESFNQKTLNLLNKKTDVETVKQSIRNLIEVGITEMRMSMMFGLPGETDADIRNTLDVCHEFPGVYFKFFSLYPSIGTKLFNNLENYGVQMLNANALIGHSQIQTAQMSNERINEWIKTAYQEFHDPDEDFHRDFSIIFAHRG